MTGTWQTNGNNQRAGPSDASHSQTIHIKFPDRSNNLDIPSLAHKTLPPNPTTSPQVHNNLTPFTCHVIARCPTPFFPFKRTD